jgi:hypothetical protein
LDIQSDSWPHSAFQCKCLTVALSASSSASSVLTRYVSSVIFASLALIPALATSLPFFTPSVTVLCLASTLVNLVRAWSGSRTLASCNIPKTPRARSLSAFAVPESLKRLGVGVWYWLGVGVSKGEDEGVWYCVAGSGFIGVTKELAGIARCSVCGVSCRFGFGDSSSSQGSRRLGGIEVSVLGFLLGVSIVVAIWLRSSSNAAPQPSLNSSTSCTLPIWRFLDEGSSAYGGGGDAPFRGVTVDGSVRELLERAATSRGAASVSHRKNLHRNLSSWLFWQVLTGNSVKTYLRVRITFGSCLHQRPLLGPSFFTSKWTAGRGGLQSPK